MNFNWTDAQNGLDIIDHIWIGLVLILVTGIPSWFAARNHKGIQEVKDQVKNGHTQTNLRDDLDRVIAAVDDICVDMRGLRQDLALEEDRRRSAVADLYVEIDHRTGRHRRQED